MKLLRVGELGAEKTAVLVAPKMYVDVSDAFSQFDGAFFASGGIERVRELLKTRTAQPLRGQRIGAPIARPHQLLCIGLNYADHAAETGQQLPNEPIVFNKAPNTLVGPNDNVHIPRGSTKTDWEVELGIVVGARSQYLKDEVEATEHIAGYVLVNDVSEREFQLPANQPPKPQT